MKDLCVAKAESLVGIQVGPRKENFKWIWQVKSSS